MKQRKKEIEEIELQNRNRNLLDAYEVKTSYMNAVCFASAFIINFCNDGANRSISAADKAIRNKKKNWFLMETFFLRNKR